MANINDIKNYDFVKAIQTGSVDVTAGQCAGDVCIVFDDDNYSRPIVAFYAGIKRVDDGTVYYARRKPGEEPVYYDHIIFPSIESTPIVFIHESLPGRIVGCSKTQYAVRLPNDHIEFFEKLPGDDNV